MTKMNKILIKVVGKNLVFCKYHINRKEPNLNSTNIIDTNNIIFTDEYILSNLELVAAFIKVIVLKYNINCGSIQEYDIALPIIKLLKQIPEIDHLIFKENNPLPHDIYEVLNEHHLFDTLECYNMAEYMFEDLNRKGYHINLKSKVFFVSKFMHHDDLKTYSDLYYKTKICIDFILDDLDLKEFAAFLKINNHLKVIELTNYNKENLEKIIDVLNQYRKRQIKIYLYEHDGDLIPDIPYLQKLSKDYKRVYKFKIIYSEQYKEANQLKQINLNILKAIILILMILIVTLLLINKNEEHEVQELSDEINKVKEEIIHHKVTPAEATKEKEKTNSVYHTKFSKVFSELKKINDETVGWLTVNGTNIDYPVVKHSDNDYYLSHDFNKNPNRYGWLFADYHNSITPLNQNTIIYGHDSGTVMFSNLYKTKNKSWYTNKNNQIITFNTEKENAKWQIFSIYSIDNTTDYLTITFGSNQSFENYINTVKKRSIYDFKINVSTNDKLLTLSTCYGSKQKLVIHAKKIN